MDNEITLLLPIRISEAIAYEAVKKDSVVAITDGTDLIQANNRYSQCTPLFIGAGGVFDDFDAHCLIVHSNAMVKHHAHIVAIYAKAVIVGGTPYAFATGDISLQTRMEP